MSLKKTLWLFIALFHLQGSSLFGLSDPLPSWNKGEAKESIMRFVMGVTDKSNPHFVPQQMRIAVFDQDGTLWVEQPFYTQGIFALDRVKELAFNHPEWKEEEPFKSILENNNDFLHRLTEQDIAKIISATHSGITVDEFRNSAARWLQTAQHPRFERHYTQLIYQPMLELMQLLMENDFTVYIVSGGGQEFIRVYAEPVYKIPPEQVIGSAAKVRYAYQQGHPVLINRKEILFIDESQGKPESINLFIGRQPIAAFGNSDGDREMLEWTKSGGGIRLAMLVHHDDSRREYAYGEHSKVGHFSPSLMEEAKKNGWIVISMKDDWNRIFPFEEKELDSNLR